MTSIWQYLNNCFVQEQRVQVQSMHRHHGTNATHIRKPNYSDRVQTKHIPVVCVLCWQSAVSGAEQEALTDHMCRSGDYDTYVWCIMSVYIMCSIDWLPHTLTCISSICGCAHKYPFQVTRLAVAAAPVLVQNGWYCRPAEAWKTALIPFQSTDWHTDDLMEEVCVLVSVCVYERDRDDSVMCTLYEDESMHGSKQHML